MSNDDLIAELERENQMLRARNERLEKEAAEREWVWLTYDEINEIYDEYGQCRKYGYEEAIQEKLREKNT
jgi:hypothetical protein